MVVLIASYGASEGLGHVRRCLRLAEMLKRHSKAAALIIIGNDPSPELETEVPVKDLPRMNPGGCLRALEQLGEPDARVIMDSYLPDQQIEDFMSGVSGSWGRFIYRAPEHFSGSYVIGLNPQLKAELPPEINAVLGLEYAILAEQYRFQERESPAQVRHLVMSFGGGDDRGWARRFAETLVNIEPIASIALMTTRLHPDLDSLRALVTKDSRIHLHIDSPDFSQRLASADVAIVSAGTTLMEAVALGVPAAGVALVDNQQPILTQLKEQGACIDATNEARLLELLDDKNGRVLREQLLQNCKTIQMHKGAERLVNKLIEYEYV